MSVSKKKAARRHRRTVTERGATVKSILWALPITVSAGLLLLFLATALLMTTSDPARYHTIAGLLLIYFTSLVGGFAAVRLNHRNAPLLCGLGEGLLLLVLLSAIGIFLPSAWKSNGTAWLLLLARISLLPTALLGSLFGTRRTEKRRSHRRY